MNSSQLAMSRFEVEFFTPRPMTFLSFSFSFETSGEKSESPEQITKVVMWSLEATRSMASTTMRMSAEFLPDVVPLGNVDQLDRGLVELPLVLRVPRPVGVGLLEDDLALLDQPLQNEVDVELLVLRVADAERDVLEVDEEREALLDGGRASGGAELTLIGGLTGADREPAPERGPDGRRRRRRSGRLVAVAAPPRRRPRRVSSGGAVSFPSPASAAGNGTCRRPSWFPVSGA